MFDLKSINIYPIKSLGGFEVTDVNCLETGLEYDRNWMLVDENGKFLSQRTIPKMAQFSTTIDDGILLVNYKDESLKIDLMAEGKEYIPINVWKHNFEGQLIEDRIDEWFSDMIDNKCYLVKMGKKSIRKKVFLKKPFSTNLSFSDGYPYLILGTASMDLLNSKLEDEVKSERFRPNITVETSVPHEEDEWDYFRIGSVSFRNIKPCVRCAIPTLNAKTLKFGKEPIKTLSGYRKDINGVIFASNAICLESGKININDKLSLQ